MYAIRSRKTFPTGSTRRNFHQFSPLSASLSPRKTRGSFCACWEYLSPVTGGTNVARKSQTQESKFSKSIPELERALSLRGNCVRQSHREILPSAGLRQGESGALLAADA